LVSFAFAFKEQGLSERDSKERDPEPEHAQRAGREPGREGLEMRETREEKRRDSRGGEGEGCEGRREREKEMNWKGEGPEA
jgi:hypothetical protein